MIWNFFRKDRNTRSGAVLSRDEKAKEGINFTIEKYGQTLKDLARYDRGELTR